jgi:TolB-like protein/tRNA A-37 threonylcarbamoyl transferase component Bud32
MELREELQHTLGSTYTLERELQRGGMARVFVATETRLRRNVVVKVLSPELAADVSGERFEREIQLAASLQQANIVPVLSAGDMDGVPYYTMPYVEGESLRALLTTRGALSINETVSILRDVARALSYAHAHSVVHRDIKPDNVLLSHGAAVVTDFGIAKAISASRTSPGDPTLTQAGAPIGTPSYMAPEQVAGDPTIDQRADVYAFGCMAYELLTGHPPFTDPSPQRVLVAHLSEVPKPVPELRPETPPSLASLVMRCLAKRAEDRPASANELLQTLGGLATPSGDAPSSVSRRAASGRRRLVFGSAATMLVLVAAAGWWRGYSAVSEHLDRSIVVLPLVNLSGDKANDYFGEGLAEEITDALNKAGVRVIGRSSAATLLRKGFDAREIARRVSAAYMLQGSVQQSRENGRITMNLTSVQDGATLWSEKYDEPFQDIFAVQDSIAHSVANALRVTLTGGATTRLVRKETNPEAHALYLQGLSKWDRRSAQTLHQAIRLFEQAADRDPNYARAYAGIAMAYAVLPIYDDVPTDATLSKALNAAHRALALDNTLAQPYAVLGYASATRFENAVAERSLATAVRLDSNFATAHYWHSLLLGHLGRDEASMSEGRRARAIDPVSLVIQTALATELYNTHRYAAADSSDSAVVAFEPTFTVALLLRGRILTEQRRFDDAIAMLEPLSRQPNTRSTEKLGLLAYAYARAGRAAQSRATLARLPRDTLVSAGGTVAAALDALGDRDSAVTMFRRAVEQHDPWLFVLGRSAPYDGLRGDPRVTALFAKIEAPQ